MNTLGGKTAIVTDASHGAGRVAALALARAGAQVIVHHRRSPDAAQAVMSEIRAMGCRSEVIDADLATPDGPHRLARRVRAIVGERLDILVANAGIRAGAAGDEIGFEDFSTHLALNVRAPYFLVQQLMPIMCQGSSVVFLLPRLGHQASAAQRAHDAAVIGAVQTLAKHFAYTLGERGIRVNAVSVEPELGQQASAIAFLASDAARWITGETMRINAIEEQPGGRPYLPGMAGCLESLLFRGR
jgi:3-oxoacyl-[acyl-carrier protein] reductase